MIRPNLIVSQEILARFSRLIESIAEDEGKLGDNEYFEIEHQNLLNLCIVLHTVHKHNNENQPINKTIIN